MSRQRDTAASNSAITGDVLRVSQEFLGDFNPQTSTRERRKLTRSNIYKASYTNSLHDRDGKMIENGTNFCDCLEPNCPGCHFPCVKCSSQKCSVDCRRNRKWTCDFVELEGTTKLSTLESALKKHEATVAKQLATKPSRHSPILLL